LVGTPTGGQRAAETFGLKYGELEDLIVATVGGHRETVITRFRKLRPKFAPDMLLSRPGVRVSYDLPRAIAIVAVYLVNSITVPQAQAVGLVIANFPEIARGCLVAWEAIQAGERSDDSKSTVFIRIDAFDDAWEANPAGATWASVGPDDVSLGAQIVLNCHFVVAHLTDAQEARGNPQSLRWAFEELDRAYGWNDRPQGDEPVTPTRLGSAFFSTGPYFARARVLLSAKADEPIGPLRRAMLQAHQNYVEAPPPIDAWKKYLGTDENELRLYQLLAVWGAGLGLQSSMAVPEVWKARAFPSDIRAAALVEWGERELAELIDYPGL
jgi:hypothetical protein